MEEGLLGQQFSVAMLTTTVLEWLKSKPWFPLAGYDSAKINRITSLVIAIATGVGLHFAFDPTINNGTLTITGLNFESIWHSGWAAAEQYAMQHFIYWTAVRPANGKNKDA